MSLRVSKPRSLALIHPKLHTQLCIDTGHDDGGQTAILFPGARSPWRYHPPAHAWTPRQLFAQGINQCPWLIRAVLSGGPFHPQLYHHYTGMEHCRIVRMGGRDHVEAPVVGYLLLMLHRVHVGVNFLLLSLLKNCRWFTGGLVLTPFYPI